MVSSLPTVLKSLREKRGLSIHKAAKEIGIVSETLRRYECDERKPTSDVILLLADYYNVPTDYLLGRTESRSVDNKVQAAVDITGLTDEAVEKLQKLKKVRRKMDYPEMISALIEDYNCEFFLEMIAKRISVKAEIKNVTSSITDEKEKGDAVAKYRASHIVHCNGNDFHHSMDNDKLIDAVLQTEFIKNLDSLCSDYLEKHQTAPIEHFNEWHDAMKEIAQLEVSGEITEAQKNEMVQEWLDGKNIQDIIKERRS